MVLSDQKNLPSKNRVLSTRLEVNKMLGKKYELTIDTIVNTVWVSTFLALMLSPITCHIHGNLFCYR